MIKVELPLNEAIEKAALQNFNRDLRMGLVEFKERFIPQTRAWDKMKKEYLEEARVVLETEGANYLPEAPDTEWYCVKK